MKEFFVGFVQGALGHPPVIYKGALRTADNLGLRGEAARSQVVFENEITRKAMNMGLRCLTAEHSDKSDIRSLWSSWLWHALPQNTRASIRDWGLGISGQVVGGAAASVTISGAIVASFGRAGLFASPALFICSLQGSIAALWKWRHQ